MTTLSKQAVNGCDSHMTYFAYLSVTDQMPTTIKSLIDRYNIKIYDESSVPPSDPASPESTLSFNLSANNNDDDVDQVLPAPPDDSTTSPNAVFKLKVPSFTRRLSKLGRRSSSEKIKAAAESSANPVTSDVHLEMSSSGADDGRPLETSGTSGEFIDQQKSKDHKDKDMIKCDEGTKNTRTVTAETNYAMCRPSVAMLMVKVSK